jgi:hypothetical protein
MRLDNFTLSIRNLDDFIYKSTSDASPKIRFSELSKAAHTAHASITRRYRIFMRIKRSEDTNINKARAKRCCNMVKKHIKDLKKVRAYIYKNGMNKDHPIFSQKIDGWINQCERIHERYKHHINDL